MGLLQASRGFGADPECFCGARGKLWSDSGGPEVPAVAEADGARRGRQLRGSDDLELQASKPRFNYLERTVGMQ